MKDNLCKCGCGKTTTIATRNRYKNNWVKGSPKPFLKGHNSKHQKSPVVKEGEKWCPNCKVIKLLDDFAQHNGKSNKLNKQTHCKICSGLSHKIYIQKNRNKEKLYTQKIRLMKKYGMTLNDYQLMYDKQQGLCAICGNPETLIHSNFIRSLAVDHCHKTNAVRSLLCNNCNRVLGMVKEDTKLLYSMIKYIKNNVI